jgi:hypothetical protein
MSTDYGKQIPESTTVFSQWNSGANIPVWAVYTSMHFLFPLVFNNSIKLLLHCPTKYHSPSFRNIPPWYSACPPRGGAGGAETAYQP